MPGVKRGGGLPRPPGGLFKIFSGKSDNDTKKVLKNNKGKKQVESAPRKSNTFEGLIRKMVNKPDYKFGVSFFYKLVEFLARLLFYLKLAHSMIQYLIFDPYSFTTGYDQNYCFSRDVCH